MPLRAIMRALVPLEAGVWLTWTSLSSAGLTGGMGTCWGLSSAARAWTALLGIVCPDMAPHLEGMQQEWYLQRHGRCEVRSGGHCAADHAQMCTAAAQLRARLASAPGQNILPLWAFLFLTLGPFFLGPPS